MKTSHMRQLLNELLSKRELKALEIAGEDEDVDRQVEEILESKDNV